MNEVATRLYLEARAAFLEYAAAVEDETLAKTYAHSATMAVADAYRKKEMAMQALETLWEQVP